MTWGMAVLGVLCLIAAAYIWAFHWLPLPAFSVHSIATNGVGALLIIVGVTLIWGASR